MGIPYPQALPRSVQSATYFSSGAAMRPLRPGTLAYAARMRVAVRRIVAQPVTALSTVVVLWASTALLAAAPMYTEAVATGGVRESLASAQPSESAVQLSAPVSAETLEPLTVSVTDALAGLDAVVYRVVVSESFELEGRDGQLTILAEYDGIEQHARLLEGRWPAQADQAAVPEGTARQLDLAPGDRLRASSRRDAGVTVAVVVSGIYRPDDVASAYWWGEELETAGISEGGSFTTVGPLVLPAGRVLEHNTAAQGRWRAVPEFSQVTADDLDQLQLRVASLPEGAPEGPSMSRDPSEAERLSVDTELPLLLAGLRQTALASRSGVLIATVLVAVLAGYGLVFIAGLLAERRRDQSLLLLVGATGSNTPGPGVGCT